MSTSGTSKRPYQRHPWAKWFSRKRFTLVHGKHYDNASYSMAQSVRNKATSEGVKVSVRILSDPERIEVTVSKESK